MTMEHYMLHRIPVYKGGQLFNSFWFPTYGLPHETTKRIFHKTNSFPINIILLIIKAFSAEDNIQIIFPFGYVHLVIPKDQRHQRQFVLLFIIFHNSSLKFKMIVFDYLRNILHLFHEILP